MIVGLIADTVVRWYARGGWTSIHRSIDIIQAEGEGEGEGDGEGEGEGERERKMKSSSSNNQQEAIKHRYYIFESR